MACTTIADARVVALCGVVLCTACGSDAAVSCDNGVDGIVSAGALPDTPDEADFTELWRIVGAEDDAYLSTPLPVALSQEGRAAVADFDLGELFIIEADGTWRGRIARSGMGPGELSSPVAAVWADDGSLHVYDIMKSAIVRFNSDLSHAGEDRVRPEIGGAIVASGSLDWAGIQPHGALVLMPGIVRTPGAAFASEVLIRAHAQTAALDTLRAGTVPVVDAGDYTDVRMPGHDRLSASTGSGGLLAVIGGEAGWLVDLYDAGRAPVLRLCGIAPEQPLSDIERGRGAPVERQDIAAAIADGDPPPEPARYGRVIVGADRTIWVQRERRSVYPDRTNLYGDPGTTFDVFSPAGDRIRTLELPAAARLQGALGDTVWAYELSELDEVHLVAYRIRMRLPARARP